MVIRIGSKGFFENKDINTGAISLLRLKPPFFRRRLLKLAAIPGGLEKGGVTPFGSCNETQHQRKDAVCRTLCT
jgi:hypothetical protein